MMSVLAILALTACDRLPDLVDDARPQACAERLTTWADADGDGAGDATRAAIGCAPPDGYVDNADDCDDTDPSRVACEDDTGDTGAGDTGPRDTGADSGAAP
jgi:hypothetical protein